MLWCAKDMELYVQERPFIDTAVLPLVPVSFDRNIRQLASQFEWIQFVAGCLESQFKGRIVLLPAFSYLQHTAAESAGAMLLAWEAEMTESGFRHIFYLTSDPSWQPFQSELNGSVVWLPAVPLEHMEQKHRETVVDEQVKQLISIIVREWQEDKT
ncbi:hypothetical protein BpJC7_29130 [Weizmannia acidilactici]|uniref:DUF2487 family protein n=2 Tax=Weizmannia acidilactici TaxID=2607726 RepID=A0A5J4JLV3_9BACI|nr:hypothetical protein BpJC4_04850 [Weizmannia acidilactici]GER71610.1 hypothetical protein BpJC7_29130 [Weizmannia acidilactici]GER74943.1 hypothetical protein BpPP18_30100 [Weizmannia acidilactici]